MKISLAIGGYDRTNTDNWIEYIQEAERLGVEAVWSAEAWGFDGVTGLAYLAARTERIKLATGILQISARVPAMTAMTALSLNALSNGRFILGLGVSGPQVVEGLHGADYSAPLTRLREQVDIIRMAFRGEKLVYDGKRHVLPRPGGEGKALRIDHEPADIPIYLATLAPRSLEYTGATADGWLGTSFSPDHAEAHLAHIRKGAESAGRTLTDIDLVTACTIAIGDDVEGMIDSRRPAIAFSLGAMGSASTNFYNDAFRRAGYEDEARAIQALWIDGKRKEAAALVPDELVTRFAAIGTPDMVRHRLKAYRDAGINGLQLRFDPGKRAARRRDAPDHRDRLTMIGQVMDLLRD